MTHFIHIIFKGMIYIATQNLNINLRGVLEKHYNPPLPTGIFVNSSKYHLISGRLLIYATYALWL